MERLTSTQVPYIELPENSFVDKAHIRELLRKLNNNDVRFDSSQNELIKTLGGMHYVLSQFVSEKNEISLSTKQLQDVSDILTTKQHKSYFVQSAGMEIYQMNLNDRKQKEVQYLLKKTNCYIANIFEQETVDKLMRFLFGMKLFIFLLVINNFWIVGFICFHEMSRELEVYFFIFKILCMLINYCYGTLMLLTVNKRILQLSLKTFLFWFKTLTAIKICTLRFILEYMFFHYDLTDYFQLIDNVLLRMVVINTIILFSVVDGLQFAAKFKLYIGIGVSVLFTVYTIYDEFINKETQIIAHIIVGNVTFDVLQWYMSGLNVLCIFLWRQTLNALFRPNKCASVRHYTSIQWF